MYAAQGGKLTEVINATHQNPKYLPGVSSATTAVESAALWLVAQHRMVRAGFKVEALAGSPLQLTAPGPTTLALPPACPARH
jgi:hypothetical protein